MRSIPDDILDKMAALRPALSAEIQWLRDNPEQAHMRERSISYAFLGGAVGEPLSAIEVWYLAAASAGHPYGRYIDLDYAADRSGFSSAHLRRLCIAGTIPALRWVDNNWYADREQLPTPNPAKQHNRRQGASDAR